MTTCNDIQFLSHGINLTAMVFRKSKTRNVTTRYGPSKVCDAFLKDETAIIPLTLWGHDTARIKIADIVAVKNGYVTTWNGVRSLDAGFYGSIHIINKQEQPKQTQQPTDLASEIDPRISVVYEADVLHDDGLTERIKQDRQFWRESLA